LAIGGKLLSGTENAPSRELAPVARRPPLKKAWRGRMVMTQQTYKQQPEQIVLNPITIKPTSTTTKTFTPFMFKTRNSL